MKLEAGQVAVVTGAASGIGRGLAEAFTARGLSVMLADVEELALRAALEQLADRGSECHGEVVDVSDAAQVDALAQTTLERFGRVDVVCNNAGVVARWAPMWELEPTDWEWTMGVNLWGVVNGIRAFVPHLVAQGSGHVVNTASMGGLTTLPGNAPYCASKHAVVAITETLREELAQVGARVGTTVLCPGLVDTRINTSERNRPGNLQPTRDTGPELRPQPNAAAGDGAVTPSRLAPDAVAAAVIEGIEHDRLFVLPSPGSRARWEARFERLAADAP